MDWFIKKKYDHASYVISIQQFKEVDINDSFFTPFRQAYGEYYDKWVELKKDDYVYTVYDQSYLVGFLKLKIEDKDDDFTGIVPPFSTQRRLKISSMRTLSTYPGLGSRFMGIILSVAREKGLNEIYGTFPEDLHEKARVDRFFEKWGFRIWGRKYSRGLTETVITRNLSEGIAYVGLFGIDV